MEWTFYLVADVYGLRFPKLPLTRFLQTAFQMVPRGWIQTDICPGVGQTKGPQHILLCHPVYENIVLHT